MPIAIKRLLKSNAQAAQTEQFFGKCRPFWFAQPLRLLQAFPDCCKVVAP
jgi:hypothetical protein